MNLAINLDPYSLSIPEGSSRTYTATLTAPPSGDVEVTISGVDGTDLSLDADSLTFTTDNWDVPQAVTATAQTDADSDEDGITIRHTANGGGYAGVEANLSATITEEPAIPVTIEFEEATYEVEEGENVTITVTLSEAPGQAVSVPITVTENTASGADYSEAPRSILIRSSQTEHTFTFTTVEDFLDEDDESVTLTFGTFPPGVAAGDTLETVITITDDDTPGVTVEPTTLGITEGDNKTYTVVLDTVPDADVTVTITPTGDATVSTDEADLIFTPGNWNVERTVTVSAAEDADADDGTATIEHTVSGYGSVTSAEDVDVTVTDNEPAVVVSFGQATYAADEADDEGTTDEEENKAVIKVKLDKDPDRQVVVDLLVTEQGAEKDDDYNGIPGSVTFEDGETEVEFTFTTVDDTLDDDDESVKITFDTLPGRVSSGTPDETTISINDDDDPRVTVSFGKSSYPVAESDDITTTEEEEYKVTVKVTLNADPERTVIIPITPTNQGGASNSDYTGVPPNVTFDKGDTEKTFTIIALHDTEDDDEDSVLLTFGALPARVTEGVTPEATITITDDDDPEVKVSFKQSSYPVAESDDESTTEDEENKVEVEVVLDADPERTVIIPITPTNQDGASNADYTVPASVTFNSGDTEKTFAFTALHDTEDDDGESVKLTFGILLPTRVTKADTNQETVVSIADDDKPASLTVNFEQSSYTVGEGSNVKVKLTLDDDPEMDVLIRINKTNQGDATNADYSALPTSVTFNSGDTEKTFTFNAVNDTDDDDDESVRLTFGTLPTIVSAGTIDETVVNITDDDVPAVTVRFEQGSYTVPESDDTSTADEKENEVTVKVQLSADPERTVTIPIIPTNQDGASNSDYSGVPNSVTFNSGDTEKTFTFTATHDTEDDDGESVKLTFGALPTRVSEGATNEAVVSITDDDDPEVTVRFEPGPYTAAESDDTSTADEKENKVTVKVQLSADPERTVTIPIDRTNQGGASDSDYSGVPESVTFNSGDTEKTFTFTATHDTEDDDGESVKLTFGALPTRVSEGATDEAVVSITDDDDPEVTVSFALASYTVPESDDTSTADVEENKATVKIVLSADPERTVIIPVKASEHDSATHHDYRVPASVTFNAGQTEKAVIFEAVHDDIDENDERVVLSFGNMPHRVTVGNPGMTGITITDDDGDGSPVEANFRKAAHDVVEGDDVILTVELSKAADHDVTAPLRVRHFNGIEDEDYSGVPDGVLLPRGETTKSFTFTAVDDSIVENDEVAAIHFHSLPSTILVGDRFGTDVTIKDDDASIQELNLACNNQADKIIILDATGNISQAGETDYWTVDLDPYRVYLVEVLGADSGIDVLGEDSYEGDLTLADPDIISVWNYDRSSIIVIFTSVIDNAGNGRNSIAPVRHTGRGPFQIEVASSDGGTGAYQIKVRVNNVCGTRDGEVFYPWFGGPEGYVMDLPADTRTKHDLTTAPGLPNHPTSMGGFLGDNWDSDPDEDWYRIELTRDYEYTVELWTSTGYPEEHQATQLKVLGIYDMNGTSIDGTASSSSGKSVSMVFRPDSTGRYYISVGSEGDDRTGVYDIRVVAEPAE